MPTVRLPTAQRGVEAYRIGPASPYAATASGDFPRLAYAAAHVVADPMVDVAPWQTVAVDWDATLAFRRHLWGLGFKIAEAMDTSQRGMGLDWPTARELIRRSLAEARTDRRAPTSPAASAPTSSATASTRRLDDVRARLRGAARGGRGRRRPRHPDGQPRPGPRPRARPTTISTVYGGLIRQAREPVILHWLGDMFDPQLAGYWGSTRRRRGDRDRADPDQRAPQPDRRHQDLAARAGARGGAAPPAAAGAC